jgi:hypothetical protein
VQAGFDSLTTANQQLTDAAAARKASFDTQKASYDRLQVREPDVEQSQVSMSRHTSHPLQVDSGLLQAGFDSLTTANQHLTDAAAGRKASFDIQKASYDRLQVGDAGGAEPSCV